MKEYPDLCRKLLEQAFNLQIGELDYLGYENIFGDFHNYKDTRTEIYAYERNTTRFFTVEMQDNPDDYLGKKMRYYRAIMDKDSYQRMNTFADLYIVRPVLFNRTLKNIFQLKLTHETHIKRFVKL